MISEERVMFIKNFQNLMTLPPKPAVMWILNLMLKTNHTMTTVQSANIVRKRVLNR